MEYFSIIAADCTEEGINVTTSSKAIAGLKATCTEAAVHYGSALKGKRIFWSVGNSRVVVLKTVDIVKIKGRGSRFNFLGKNQ